MKIKVGKYEVEQSSCHHVTVWDGKRMVGHIIYREQLTEEELRQEAELFLRERRLMRKAVYAGNGKAQG